MEIMVGLNERKRGECAQHWHRASVSVTPIALIIALLDIIMCESPDVTDRLSWSGLAQGSYALCLH